MNRKSSWVWIGLAIIFVTGVFVLSQSHHKTSSINDGREPEGQILRMVKFDGAAKLSSLLPPPQLNAAQSELSTYIHANIGNDIYTATIESTVLQNDGSIDLKVKAGNQTFDSVIDSGSSQFIFKVPSDNYQTSTPQSIVENQYSGSSF